MSGRDYYMPIRQFVNYYLTTDIPNDEDKSIYINKLTDLFKLSYSNINHREYIVMIVSDYNKWPLRFIIAALYKARHYFKHVQWLIKYLIRHNQNILQKDYERLIKHHILPKYIYNGNTDFVQKYVKIPRVQIYCHPIKTNPKKYFEVYNHDKLIRIEVSY
jgi:hypothetical protein